MADAEEPVVERDEKLRFLFNGAAGAVLLADPTGTVVDANDLAVERLGYARRDLATMHVADLEGDVDRDALRERWGRDDPVTYATDLRRADGSTMPVTVTVREVTLDGRQRMVVTCRDATERRERERALDRYETIVDTIEDGVYVLDEELRFAFVNDALCRMIDVPRNELLGSLAADHFEYDEEWEIARETRRRVVEGDESIGRFTATYEGETERRRIETRYRLHPEPDGEYRGSVGVIRDVTEREDREQTLRRQRDELATLDRINELLLETVRELIQTSRRDAVERAVCERLTDTSFYDLAWIGEPALTGDDIVARVVAGAGADYLEGVTFEAGDDSPAGRALETGDVAVASVDDPAMGPWRDAARDHGLDTIAAVPLRRDDQVYGILEVGTTREDGFTDRERAGLDALGRTVGFVVYAARSRDLLFADSVVELTFDLTGTDAPFVGRLPNRDGALELDGYVPVGDEWLCYLTIQNASPAAVLEVGLDDPRLREGRVITDGDDGGIIELTMAESAILDAVTGVGATVGEATVGPDGARIVVDAPADCDVREVVRRIQSAAPGAEFVAHRERDRAIRTVGRPDGVLEDLTDRQREVLRAAYRAGYFAWPRESDATEVAAALDIDRSTVHAHLRKAQERLLSALLGDG